MRTVPSPTALFATDIIGVPMDWGASRRGVRFGPDAVRATKLLEELKAMRYTVRDRGDIEVPGSVALDVHAHEPVRYLEAVRATCSALAELVERSLRDGAFPIIIGGDHSMAIGALSGVARAKGAQGVIWIDAHADVNTPETTPSGNLHGMAMAVALGALADLFPPPAFVSPAVDEQRCVFVGLREVDAGESRALKSRKVTCFTMSDIDRLGMNAVMQRAIELAAGGPRSVHISLDIDSLDPTAAPGTGTPVPGGLTYREAHLAMELLAESGVAHSLQVAEVNPVLDEHNLTANIAMELICSLLGKTII